ncbi:hypothetical protein [Novosphingobium olei]|uniref:Uncharacterized protein n=1 Tax=Novosphingobium olei TaxID=2728851 RepID=A0A7Y0BKW3_9SPHN|nr:hypothetical protein [Novosphingobium olei]NML92190.1 hypothetical protein [Novosphingobium olei]BEV01942.1 rhs-associated protein [Novosphingobium olei]
MDRAAQELRDALALPIAAGTIGLYRSSEDIGRRLEQSFPFAGAKIDWSLTRGHLAVSAGARSLVGFSAFFEDRRTALGNDQPAFYLSEGPIDFALRASLITFQRHLRSIVSVPAHHYFVAEDFSWCIVYSMEGDIDFGWSPVHR